MSDTSATTPNPGAQSQQDHAKNFHDAATEVGHKLSEHPESLTKGEANHLKSMEAKHIGIQQPPKDSISAAAARVVAANERCQHVHEDAATIAQKVLDSESK